MGKIDITTTHNVVIEYELASILDRILAFVVDFIFIWLCIGISYFIIYRITRSDSPYLFYFVGSPIFFFYNLLLESLNNGQTLGKKFLGIKVVKINGEKAGIMDYFLRWSFRFIDIYLSFGTLAILSISSSPRNQRIGDLLADTGIIKVDPRRRVSLDNILNMKAIKGYEPKFPEIKQLTENEMLVVKEAVDRYKQYPNENHQEVIDGLVEKIKKELEITPLTNNIDFLNTLITDYVVLTR